MPIDYVGVSPASAAADRFVAHELQVLEVRCLPDDLPRSIEVDVSGLDQAGDVVRIASVASPEGVEILNDPDDVAARVEFERVEEEAEAEDEFGLVGGIGEIGDTAGDGEAEAAPPS